MSKIGNKPIHIPVGVTIDISESKMPTYEVKVTGPKGILCQEVKQAVRVRLDQNSLIFDIKKPENGALQGLYRSLVDNMVKGVTVGWNKGLELKGVGFRALVNGDMLILTIGFSHTVDYKIPTGVTITVAENKINVTGIDKQLVGQTSAEIRHFRPPEPYKGKGIRYIGEIVRKKAGKQAVKAGAA